MAAWRCLTICADDDGAAGDADCDGDDDDCDGNVGDGDENDNEVKIKIAFCASVRLEPLNCVLDPCSGRRRCILKLKVFNEQWEAVYCNQSYCTQNPQTPRFGYGKWRFFEIEDSG